MTALASTIWGTAIGVVGLIIGWLGEYLDRVDGICIWICMRMIVISMMLLICAFATLLAGYL